MEKEQKIRGREVRDAFWDSFPWCGEAVALGARFTCVEGGCGERAGEKSNKHSRWETKAG